MAASRSTDKLALLCHALKDISPEVLAKVISFKLDWNEVDGVAVPLIEIKFKD